MSATQDYVALDWIKGEVTKTLEQAQFALESVAESEDDASSMRSCLTSLHQVHGTMKMVELTGPAQVADEMEQLAQALMNKNVPDVSKAQAILMQTILQMPPYLDLIQREQSDSEKNYLPLVNNLRVARDEPRIGLPGSGPETTALDLTPATRPPTDEVIAAFVAAKGEVTVPKIRQRYQQALAALLQKKKARENLNLLGKVFAMILKLCGESPMGNLAQLGIALIEGIATGAIKLTGPVVNFMRAIDAELARLSEGGVSALSEPVSKKLVAGVLKAIEGASTETEKMIIAKEIFSSAASKSEAGDMEEVTIGPDDETLAAVSRILIEELKGITDKLDLYVLSAERQVSDLVELIPGLEQIASTLLVVSMSKHQEAVLKQIGIIKEIETGDIDPNDEVLLELAKDLLEIESTLGSIVGTLDDGTSLDNFGNLDEAQAAVVKETRNGLALCRDTLIEFVSNDFDHSKIQDLPVQLSTLKGGLSIVNQERPGDVLDAASRYVQHGILANSTRPGLSEMDDLADTITSIDYYLERLIESSKEPYLQMLEVAEAAIEKLGYPVRSELVPGKSEPQKSQVAAEHAELEERVEVSADTVEDALLEEPVEDSIESIEDVVSEELVEASIDSIEDGLLEESAEEPVSEQPAETAIDSTEDVPVVEVAEIPSVPVEAPSVTGAAKDEEDLIDDEILEIFVEEVDEVLETINEYLPRWRNDTSNQEALVEIRRAFHGLKGSGRMVGATVLGELTWSIEELLNSVVDNTILPNENIMSLVAEVVKKIPEGLEYFKNHDQHGFLIDDYVTRAESFAAAADGSEPVEEEYVLELDDSAEEIELEELEDSLSQTVEDSHPTTVELVEADGLELVEIFAIEANERLLIIKAYLASKDEIPSDLVAAFHTLRGSAAVAEVPSIAGIAGPLEDLVTHYLTRNLEPDAIFKSLVERGVELIGTGLGNLKKYRQAIDGMDSLVKDLEAVLSTHDQDIALFEFENIVLLSEENVVSNDWHAKYVDAVKAELEHASEQAEVLGLIELQELVTSLLRIYNQVRSVPDETLISVLRMGHVRLVSMFDHIATGQLVEGAGDIITILDAITVEQMEDITAGIIDGALDEARDEALDEVGEEDSTDSEGKAAKLPAQELPEDQIDEDILPIFLEEAEELLESIDQSILDWSENSDSMENLDNLLRHLHTLKGGSRLAGMNSLGQLTHNFESFLIGVQQNPVPLDDPFFALLNREQDEITRRIEIYRKLEVGEASSKELASLRISRQLEEAQPTPEPTATTDVETETPGTEASSTTAATTAVALPADEIIEDILPIFLEEAEELLEVLEESILDWSESTEDTSFLENLLRVLHTFKGGARTAGMNSLGEFAHNFETFLIGIQKNPVDLGTEFFALLNKRQDEIVRRVEIYNKLMKGEASEEELESLKSDAIGESKPASTARLASTDEPDSGDNKEEGTRVTAVTQPQEMVRVSADLLEELIGLSGESSITRGRVEQQISDFSESLDEMEETIKRIRDQVRKLEIEAESRETLIRSKSADGESAYDELEMDRYTMLQEISRTLNESTSDMLDLRETLVNRRRDAEALLHQQGRIGSELQEGLTRTRMVPFARLIPRLRRIVRQTSGEIGKSVRFDAFNIEGELDRSVLERIVAPLEHMLRNAVDHGIESTEKRIESGKPEEGRISLRLSREGGYVILIISDDGGGIDVAAVREKAIERGLINEDAVISDQEVMQFIMDAGFSTAQKLTQISGRGVGMDVVTSEIKALGGSVTIDSTVGVGTEFTIRIPFTVSLNRALMVVVKDEIYAVPLNTIEGIVRVSPYELEAYYQPDAPMFEYAGQPYRLDYMGKMLDDSDVPDFVGQVAPLPVILARSGDRAAALQVDEVIGSREVVVKTLGPQFNEVGGVAGATVLGDGKVVIILDVMALVRSHDLQLSDQKNQVKKPAVNKREPEKKVRMVMIVDDSVTVRKVTTRLMERQGWEVKTAKDGVDAMEQLQDIFPDVVLLDIEMPKMDGFGVLKAIRRDERLKDLPIIMITSRTGEKHKREALELGVNRYLGKPFHEANLLSTIEEVISATPASQAL